MWTGHCLRMALQAFAQVLTQVHRKAVCRLWIVRSLRSTLTFRDDELAWTAILNYPARAALSMDVGA